MKKCRPIGGWPRISTAKVADNSVMCRTGSISAQPYPSFRSGKRVRVSRMISAPMTRRWPRQRSRRPFGGAAQDDVFTVDRVEAVRQEVQHRFGGGLVVGKALQ